MVTRERLERVKEVLDEALKLAPAERTSFVVRACGGDETVRREVESLLEQEEVEAPILETPIFSLHSGDPEGCGGEHPKGISPGRRIGPYQVVRELGEGGMGTVALAVREDDFEKRVALKLVRPGMLSDEVLRRFHNERQILAHLDHPNVARILDGGTTGDGQPYFVMEYVEGQPIDEYCERHALPIGRRLELFHQVCGALQVAHRNLVVHRDLKPGNILVTEAGEPKLLDFGIAKQLTKTARPGTQLTRLGQSPMTLRYASPEQIEGRPVTTASDVYALGVLLYQLLTGHFPYAPDDASDLALARAICEEEPRRPSTVVRRLAGDLDSIVLKALRKEPNQRYGSVEQLAEDVRRYLQGRPVSAREGNLSYLVGKFVRRNKLALAAASLLLLVLAFAATTAILWGQAARERELKDELFDLVDLLFLYAASDVSDGVDLERIEQELEELEVEPQRQAEILESMSRIYVTRGLYDDARAPLERALSIRRRLHPEGHPELARVISNRASWYLHRENFDEAERLYREALAMKRSLVPEEEVDIAKAISNLATAQMMRGELGEAETLYREALELRKERDGPDDPDVAASLRNLGHLLYVRSDFERAEPLLREALRIRLGIFGANDPKVASVLCSLGQVLQAQERLTEAEKDYTECLAIRMARLGKEHPRVASARRDLASLFLQMGDLSNAEALLNQALAVLLETRDEGSWELAGTRSVLGALLTAQTRYEEAEPHLAESYEVLRKVRGEKAIYTRHALRRLRELYEAWGEPEKAAQYRN